MILSRKWLNEFVDCSAWADHDFSEAMTLSGSKVETFTDLHKNIQNVVAGRIVEIGTADEVFNHISHPYTEGLMNSIPRLSTPTHTRLDAIPGAVPHPLKLPKGCKFAPRCKYATERCLNEEPEMIHVSETQQVRCFYPRKEDRHGKK